MRELTMLAAAVAAFLASAPAHAEIGDILIKGRATYQNRLDGLTLTLPDDALAIESDIEDSVGAEVSITLFLHEHLALEASLGSGNYQLRDTLGDELLSANLLISAATLQYHFVPDGKILRPYIGAGVTHLNIFGEEADVALVNSVADTFAPGAVRLSSGFAPVAQIGADIAVSDQVYLNVDAKYTTRETDLLIAREERTSDTRQVGSLIIAIGVGVKF